MILPRELVVNRNDGITLSSYHRRPPRDPCFVPAYETSAVCPKDGRERAGSAFCAEDIQSIAPKLRGILDVLFDANLLA